MLATQTEEMLWEYLDDAPDDAETYEGEYWDKYHVGYEESASSGTDADFEAQGRTKLGDDDDVAPQRPWAFECPYDTVVDPNRTQESPGCSVCNSGPTGIPDCATCVGAPIALSSRLVLRQTARQSLRKGRDTPHRLGLSRFVPVPPRPFGLLIFSGMF